MNKEDMKEAFLAFLENRGEETIMDDYIQSIFIGHPMEPENKEKFLEFSEGLNELQKENKIKARYMCGDFYYNHLSEIPRELFIDPGVKVIWSLYEEFIDWPGTREEEKVFEEMENDN